MTVPARRVRGARRGLLAAATVVLLLALGPFASPLVGHEDRAVAGEAPVDLHARMSAGTVIHSAG